MDHVSEEQHRATASKATTPSARTTGRFRDIFKSRRSGGCPDLPSKPLQNSNKARTFHSSNLENVQAPTGELSSNTNEEKPAVDCEGSIPRKVKDAFAGSSSMPTPETVVLSRLSTNSRSEPSTKAGSVGGLPTLTPVYGMSLVVPTDAQYVQTDVPGDLSAASEVRNRQKSFVSNIFDDQDSLSAGICEYVKSKIAETLHGHSCGCPVRSPVNITARFELDSGSGDLSRTTSFKRISMDTNFLYGPKRFGPFTFGHSPRTYNLQKGIVAIYFLILVPAAFAGPKTLSLTVWRLSVALSTYFVAGHLLGWEKYVEPDMFLVPVFYAIALVRNFFCDAVDQYGIFKVYLNSQIMRESLVEVGAVLNPQ